MNKADKHISETRTEKRTTEHNTPLLSVTPPIELLPVPALIVVIVLNAPVLYKKEQQNANTRKHKTHRNDNRHTPELCVTPETVTTEPLFSVVTPLIAPDHTCCQNGNRKTNTNTIQRKNNNKPIHKTTKDVPFANTTFEMVLAVVDEPVLNEPLEPEKATAPVC